MGVEFIPFAVAISVDEISFSFRKTIIARRSVAHELHSATTQTLHRPLNREDYSFSRDFHGHGNFDHGPDENNIGTTVLSTWWLPFSTLACINIRSEQKERNGCCRKQGCISPSQRINPYRPLFPTTHQTAGLFANDREPDPPECRSTSTTVLCKLPLTRPTPVPNHQAPG